MPRHAVTDLAGSALDTHRRGRNVRTFVKVQFLLAQDMPWAKKGFVQMEEQLPVKAAAAFPSVAGQTADGKLTLTAENNLKTVKGTGFEVKFDDATGTIYSLTYNGKPVFAEGNGPKLDAFRAMTDNDNWAYRQWFAKGLHNLRHKAVDAAAYTRADGAVVLAYTVESQAPYGSNIRDLGISSGRYNITKGKEFGPDDFKFTTSQIWTV